MKVRKNVTKKLKAKVYEATNNAYHEAVSEIMNIDLKNTDEIKDAELNMRSAHLRQAFGTIDNEELDSILKQKEEVDELYLKKILLLSSSMLEDILFLHRMNSIKRANKTVEYINSELVRRALLGDHSRSDEIDNNGDTRDRAANRTSSKKATTKKNKTVKRKPRI